MRHTSSSALLGGLASVALLAGGLAPLAQASFGVSEKNFEAGTCINVECTYESIEKERAAGLPTEAFNQAAGHPPLGITKFELNYSENPITKQREPEGYLKRIRTDVPPGLAANPQALPKCSIENFKADKCQKETEVGKDQLTIYEAAGNLSLEGAAFNLEQPPGLPLEFGIHVEVPGVTNEHIFLEGHVSYAKEPILEARGIPSGDYHEYFEINNVSKAVKVLRTKLIFNGQAGQGNFLTLPSTCSTSETAYLEVESYEGAISTTPTHTPIGVEGCEKVPFEPRAAVTAGSTGEPSEAAPDQPDGASTVVTVPQKAGAGELNTADIKDAHVSLPEGMTLNPSAAHGLQACTPAQIAIGTTNPVACPPGSRVGTVTIETDLPPKTLTGGVYLGGPEGGGPITGPPYAIYFDTESVYGVSVRLQGLVSPNPSTGRLEVTFTHNPELPFSELILTANGGPRAPLANPLSCGNAPTESLFTPYTGEAPFGSSTPFVTGGCPNPLPFTLSQSTQSSTAAAGAYSSYTFNLSRPDGQQFLSRVSTTLPEGLVGAIPTVPLCGEPQAAQGSCPPASQVGSATVTAGAGPEPYAFSGPVFLTGPYDGAPYGLSIAVPVVAGPLSLGTITTRAMITVDPHSSRVSVTNPPPGAPGALPSIVAGVPVRLKTLSVDVNRPGFIFNPTNCGPLATESTLTSTFGATQGGLSSPFHVAGCSALPFAPSFSISASAKTSKLEGAGLRFSLTQSAHQANIHSVLVQLPVQLPSRLTTLQKACPEATFAANPASCRSLGSEVGSAIVGTPVLPGQLTGSAYLVSHGGAAFPDLDIVLEGDGVTVILTGNTNIKGGITSTTFAALPDVPVTSFVLNLPVGPHSALTAIGSLCTSALTAPTTIDAQSGAQLTQNTSIAVSGCPARSAGSRRVRILYHKVRGHKLVLKVRTYAPGRVSVKAGKDLKGAHRRLGKATTTTFKIRLSRRGLRALRRHHPLKLRVRVRFAPSQKGESVSAASVVVRFRRRA